MTTTKTTRLLTIHTAVTSYNITHLVYDTHTDGHVTDSHSTRVDPATNVNISKILPVVLCAENTSCADSKLELNTVDGNTLDVRTRMSTVTPSDSIRLTTRRSIYIRGHLLASHRKQTFLPPLAKSEHVHGADVSARLHVTHFEKVTSSQGYFSTYDKKPIRRKKKHSSVETKRFDNIRFTHDTANVSMPHGAFRLREVFKHIIKPSSFSFGFSHQGSPQRIVHLHSILSSAASSVISATAMFSLSASINLLLGPRPSSYPPSWQLHLQHPSPNIPI